VTPIRSRRRQHASVASPGVTRVGVAPDLPSEVTPTRVTEDGHGAEAAEPVEKTRGVRRDFVAPAPTTVMVLGGGTAAGVALVLALSRSGHKVVDVEVDRTSAGLRLAQLGVVIPAPGAPDFGTALVSVAKHSESRALLTVRSDDMRFVAEAQDALKEAGTAVWSPAPDVFALCRDRSALYDVLTSSGLPVEKTGLGPIADGPGRGRQFGVDLVSDRDYELIAAVSSWRVAATDDTTMVAETFFDARMLDLVRAVCAAVRIQGPAVVRGYVSITGRAWLTEIRPGFSALLPLARAAGVDVAALALAGTLGDDMPTRLLTHRSGVRMLQYLDQVFEG
jgi:hypothetical protein